MEVTKAVITAAGRGARQYPAFDTVQKAMLPLVDRDGLTKPVLQIIAEEAIESGIEEICVVCAPGDEAVYRQQFRNYAALLHSTRTSDWAEEQARRFVDLEQRLRFAVQPEPEGYGHAVWCARPFVGDEPFLLLLSDHLYVSSESRRCARQLIDLAAAEECAVSAVQATREHLIHQYGTLTGRRLPERPDVYAHRRDHREAEPDPGRAPAPGARAPRGALPLLLRHARAHAGGLRAARRDGPPRRPRAGPIQLTTALNALARRERYLALETRGARFNLGVKFGMVEAQIALALAGADRERMLSVLLESIIRIEQESPR